MNDAQYSSSIKHRVVIVERILNHYRVPFYSHLRKRLFEVGVELQLLVGKASTTEAKKSDEGVLEWAISVPTHYFIGNRFCWQPFGRYLPGADLVVVMHENKLLYNLCLLCYRKRPLVAFWGHGRNMQAACPNNMKEQFKRWTVNKVDWYFAYTESSAEVVRKAGFQKSHITVVENAADTKNLLALCSEVNEDLRSHRRLYLGIGKGPVGLYIGSLYSEKYLDFLLESARRIQIQIPSFHLVIVGDGPDRPVVERACKKTPWLHYMGALHGKDKAEILMSADFMLNPGLVGLGILDSFVSGKPMFTTDCGLHSPEISYMVSGQNGLITKNTIEEFTTAVINSISDQTTLSRLQAGAKDSASRYTIENMASRFCEGVLSCLSEKKGNACRTYKGLEA